METCSYWKDRHDASTNEYACPWCPKTLRPKVSNSVKNPGKTFVSCSKDYGGCGLFCFVDTVPNESFNPNKKGKRSRGDTGVVFHGPVSDKPDVVNERIAELSAKMDAMASQLQVAVDYIKEVTDN